MSDVTSLMQAIVALGFVLCLIVLCAYAAKRYAPGQLISGKTRRLKLLEALPLDAKHRAVLLRCDGREHLMVLGDGRVTLVDRDLPTVDSPPPSETQSPDPRKESAQ